MEVLVKLRILPAVLRVLQVLRLQREMGKSQAFTRTRSGGWRPGTTRRLTAVLSGSVLEPEVLNGDLRRRLREEYGVFPEFIAVEFERVMEVVFAPPQSEPESTKATEKAIASAAYQVLGSAPAGERCDACGKAGGARIRLDGTVYLLHQACADRYLAAMVDPPVKIPEWPGADEEMANGRPDDPIDPDAWSFNDDAESQEPQS